jgi:hypothetical protein
MRLAPNFVNWRTFTVSLSLPAWIFSRLLSEPGLLYQGTSLEVERGPMLKIQRATNKQVVFTLSGRMNAENVSELKRLIESEARGRRMVLELSDLTLVDRDAVKFLERCETDSIKLENCPAYIREWIEREREGR